MTVTSADRLRSETTTIKEPARIDELLEHGPWLVRLARSLVQDPNVAEDVLQSTWLTALSKPPSTAAGGRTWLGRVLTNEVFVRARRERRRRRYENLAEPDYYSDSHLDPATCAEEQELRHEVVRLLLDLGEPYRSTLKLHYFDGLPSSEIAARLEVPAATVRWRLMQGLDKLRSELRRRHPVRALPALLLPLTRMIAPTAAPAEPAAGSEQETARPRSALLRVGSIAAVPIVLSFLLLVLLTAPKRAETTAPALSAPPGSAAESAPNPVSRASSREDRRVVETPVGGGAEPVGGGDLGGTRFASFEVEVVDSKGQAIAGANVLAFRRATAEFGEIGRTDERGRAELRVDAADLGAWGDKGSRGRVALRASAPEWAQSDVVFAFARSDRGRVRLVLPAPETILEGRLVNERGEAVVGGVIEAGYAQSNELCGATTRDLAMPQPVRVRSDEGGHFRICGVDAASGRVRMHAEGPGNGSLFFELIVDGDRARNLALVLPDAGRVRGEVRDSTGRPVSGARVWYEPAEHGGDAALRSFGYDRRLRGFSSATTADPEGRFDLAGVPVGMRLLWAQDPAVPERVGHAVVQVTCEEAAEWIAELATVTPLEIVVDSGLESPSGWIVRLWFEGPDGRRCIRGAETDGTGVARFFDIGSSAIDVSVFAPDTGFRVAWAVTDGIPSAPVRIGLEQIGRVTGRFRDAGGEPFAKAILRMAPRVGLAPLTRLPHDAASGDFDHSLPTGAYVLIASCNGSSAPVASFDLAANGVEDLGLIRAPALGTLRIECAQVQGAKVVEYFLRQLAPEMPRGINSQVEQGEWPPAEKRDLFPGRYVLEVHVSGDDKAPRRFPIDLAPSSEVTLRVEL